MEQVASIVEDDVRGAAVAAVLADAALEAVRMVSEVAVGSQSLAMTFHWTGVRPRSRAARRTKGRRAPWGGRKKRTGWPRVSSIAALAVGEFGADAGGGLPGEPGVGHGVVADEVSGGGDGSGDGGTLADEAADHEEGGADVVAGEDFEEALGGEVVGAVVVGEGDLFGVRGR